MSAKKKDDTDAPDAEAQPLTIGRVVLYRDAESKKQYPAIVNEITEGGDVHVCVFDSTFGPRNFVTSGEGDDAGQWSWPPRV